MRPIIERLKTPVLYATDYEGGGLQSLYHLLQRIAGAMGRSAHSLRTPELR